MTVNKVPISPKSTRVFVGYKLAELSRDDFYGALGKTFMPGTPYMQAPLGLNSYMPAVLDPNGMTEISALERIPDEVALIGYASLEIYFLAREKSLRRRMYTDSHLAVFDMQAVGGGGQFPGPVTEPSVRGDRLCWYLFEKKIDWQYGYAHLLFAVPDADASSSPEELMKHMDTMKSEYEAAGIDQVLCVATPIFAAVWLHSESEVRIDKLSIFDDAYQVTTRHLVAQPVPMKTLEEDLLAGIEIASVNITEPSMYTFQFARDDRYEVPESE
ncbi:MAG: hypothetical protein ROR55_06440 [Devosia sp.]